MMTSNSSILQSTQVSRPVADFHPDLWGDRFLVNVFERSQLEKDHELRVIQELVKEIRTLISPTTKISKQQLQLIDSILRLGVAYHFESEIDQALKTLFETYNDDYLDNDNSIQSAALCFRVLRQHGFRISCSIFDKFKDNQGKFKESITNDMKGMLEFYEAAHLIVQGEEDILDEALDFTRSHLRKQLRSRDIKDSTTHGEKIVHVLRQPFHRGVPRLEARAQISMYEKEADHNKTLLKLAKLDFNRLLSMHRTELAEISRWWKELDVPKKLPFARDRVVEGYFWILGIYFEPQYDAARKILSKVFAITSIVDDMYDAYGALEELKLFTDAIERWSYECLNGLPEYMQVAYKALLQLYEEISEDIIKQGNGYRVYYAKEAMKNSVRAYFEEATWRENKYKPSFMEYMALGMRTSGVYSLTIASYLGMGNFACKEHFQWALEYPFMIRTACAIARLKNDIMGHEFEKKRKHVVSAVDCYMKDHYVSKVEAIKELNKEVEARWKDLNECFLRPTEAPTPVIMPALNFSRLMELIYKEGDLYTHVTPEMQSYIKQVLVDPIPI